MYQLYFVPMKNKSFLSGISARIYCFVYSWLTLIWCPKRYNQSDEIIILIAGYWESNFMHSMYKAKWPTCRLLEPIWAHFTQLKLNFYFKIWRVRITQKKVLLRWLQDPILWTNSSVEFKPTIELANQRRKKGRWSKILSWSFSTRSAPSRFYRRVTGW